MNLHNQTEILHTSILHIIKYVMLTDREHVVDGLILIVGVLLLSNMGYSIIQVVAYVPPMTQGV